MNPDTNRFEALREAFDEDLAAKVAQGLSNRTNLLSRQAAAKLLRPDGSEVPKHWAVFKVGELVVIKDYTFKVAYIGETAILFEPVGPQIVGSECAQCDGRCGGR